MATAKTNQTADDKKTKLAEEKAAAKLAEEKAAAKLAEEKAAAKLAEEKAAEEAKAPDMYEVVIAPLVHPFQNVRFNLNEPVICKLDSWLKSQIKAGIIRKC